MRKVFVILKAVTGFCFTRTPKQKFMRQLSPLLKSWIKSINAQCFDAPSERAFGVLCDTTILKWVIDL